MSTVLIKGMEMPKNCMFCPMAHWNALDRLTGCEVVVGKRYVPKTDRDYWEGGHRPDWCPLVEVLTPHGDLIDRWELTETAMIDPDEGKYVAVYRADEVDEAPVIIEAEGGE